MYNELKISFIVPDCLSKTQSSRSLYELIMTLFTYSKKIEHIVLESPQTSGLNLKISILKPIHAKSKMGDSVLQSHLHQRGYHENWMAQIWDNQSD